MIKAKKNYNMITTLVLLLLGLIILFPIYIAIINSFKTDGELLNSVLSFPSQFNFINYTEAFIRLDFAKSLLNTLFITSVSIIGIIICSSLAGYKLARESRKISIFFYTFFICSMLVPFHSIMISLTKVTMNLGIKGTKLGLSATYIGLGVNMAIFLYHGFMNTVPKDLEEAAKIDGCNELSLFWHVVFPLLKSVTATVAILDALWIWNDFLLPLLMITDSNNYTLILSTTKFFGKYTAQWSSILAGLLITTCPLLIFYMIFQKNIVEGIASGAVKG